MFTAKIEKLFNQMGESQTMVLATAAENRVTARSMSVVIKDQCFYYQTDTNFLKFSQTQKNKNVALCFGNIQIEGVCTAQGSPLLSKNAGFCKLFEKHFKSSFEAYSKLPTEQVFCVRPTLITVWGYDDAKPYREFFDIEKAAYQKVFYTP